MERPEQLATARATVSTTTMTSSKQPVGQTTRAVEPTTMTANMNEPATGKDAGNMATTEAIEQEAPRQVAPE
jgi:hypothetical protein